MCNQNLFKWWCHLHYLRNNSERQFEHRKFDAKPLKIFFSKTAQENSQMLHANSPWVCVIKVCSNGGATYIIGKIIAKDNLNIENLMRTFENLILQNYSTKFLDITYK